MKSLTAFAIVAWLLAFSPSPSLAAEPSARPEGIQIGHDRGLISIHADSASVEEVLRQLSAKLDMEIIVHGLLPEARTSWRLNELAIDQTLAALLPEWEYITFSRRYRTIDIWLTPEGEKSWGVERPDVQEEAAPDAEVPAPPSPPEIDEEEPLPDLVQPEDEVVPEGGEVENKGALPEDESVGEALPEEDGSEEPAPDPEDSY